MNTQALPYQSIKIPSWQQLLRIVLLVVVAGSGLLIVVDAGAEQFKEVSCPNPTPRISPVWRNFEAFVSQEYAGGKPSSALSPEVEAIALGHALGRVALAQGEDLVMQQAVACLQRGIEQKYAILPGIYGRKSDEQRRRLHRLVISAAMGRYDDWVEKYTGVTSTSPAYQVLGLTTPPPKPAWTRPASPTPTIPVYRPGRHAKSPSGANVPPEVEACRQGVYSVYSVAEARRLVKQAASIQLPADCYSTQNYLACKRVSDQLHSAIDQLTQVLLVSRSPVGQGCKYCPLEKHDYSGIGSSIDRISRELSRKGYRTPPPDMEWHYANMEGEKLCDTPPMKGALSISPVARDDCPSHCEAARPECNYAYYVARTRTCGWKDDQNAPNLHALDSADIWDRANRRWLTRAQGPSSPTICKDPAIKTDAWARMYSRGYGGGQVSYAVKQEYLCFNKSYSKISGSTVQHFKCRDEQFDDCSLSKTDNVERQALDGGAYKLLFDGGKSWWTITPETPVSRPSPRPLDTPSLDSGFVGSWETNWGKMTFDQSGTGSYTHHNGRIKGVVRGKVLTGTWSEASSYAPPNDAGDVEFTLSEDGNSFTGRWRYGSSGSWHNDWRGKRMK